MFLRDSRFGTYLDELISIWVQAITAGSDSPAALVQHTILSADWWPYRTFILMTYHDVLKRLRNCRVQSRSLPESVCAALHLAVEPSAAYATVSSVECYTVEALSLE